VIDKFCRRRFYKDADAQQKRYYSPRDEGLLSIDDLAVLTTLKTDWDGDGVFETTWTLNTDFHLEPFNPEFIDGTNPEPWTLITVRPPRTPMTWGNLRFPTWWPRSVEVTGTFGWAAVPPAVVEATSLLAHRLTRRAREAPFSVIGIGIDQVAVRLPKTDPDIALLLDDLVRRRLVM
jgi:hypothetical protein